jgi:hypothetical protein
MERKMCPLLIFDFVYGGSVADVIALLCELQDSVGLILAVESSFESISFVEWQVRRPLNFFG